MLREETVFGPISSRRLGSSLGLNLLPAKGKICNFDCIYCECGWNKDGRGDTALPTSEDVREALEAKLRECRDKGIGIDSITFSGDGEPTLNPEFAKIIDITIELRDRYYPESKVTVLSNATMLGKEEVFQTLRKVDNPILKLDAPTNELVARINKPSGNYDVDSVVRNLERFEGNFVLQTMFLKSKDFDSCSEEVLGPWKEIVRRLSPRKVMAYTIDRPTPETGIEKYSVEQMRSALADLIEEGFLIQFNG